MKKYSLLLLVIIAPYLISCSGTGFSMKEVANFSSSQGTDPNGNYPYPTPTPSPTPIQAAKNVLPVSVGNCGANTYVNEPCVSVTICTPGTNNCQTIPNILLDTGSYGLRIFKSVVNVPLTQITDNVGRQLAECAKFVIGADWGPVQIADVVLGQQGPARVPIQLIDAAFPGLPNDCQNPDTSPQQAGFNGILGVGLFTEDCGQTCVTNANNRVYFLCAGITCAGTTVPILQQVSNPVSFMPADNNGVILQLPALPNNEAGSLTGSLILGIGTQANNTMGGVTVFPADGNGYVRIQFNGQTYNTAFIDSGTNTIAFAGPAGLTACPSSSIANGFFCPASTTSYAATVMGANGTGISTVNFQVGNADTILRTQGVTISNRLGSSFPGAFDFGLPFFFGRSVHVAIEGKNTPMGVGPYKAF